MPLWNKLAAEFIGTFWLVLGGCGSAVLAAKFPEVGHRLCRGLPGLWPDRFDDGLRGRAHLGRALQPGRHGRPGRRRPHPSRRDVVPYIIVQVVGAIAAARACSTHRQRQGGFRPRRRVCVQRLRRAFAGRVLADRAALVVRGRADRRVPLCHHGDRTRAPAGFAPIAIGLALTLIHLISIPVTNTSVNPARSTGRRCLSAAGRWRSSGCSGSRRSSGGSSVGCPTDG